MILNTPGFSFVSNHMLTLLIILSSGPYSLIVIIYVHTTIIKRNADLTIVLPVFEPGFASKYGGKLYQPCNNLTSCIYVTSLVYIRMPLILKMNIVITTQRACPIVEYYIGDEDQNISTGTMASSLPPFPPFNVEDDPTATGQRWTKWKKRFENFLLAMNIEDGTRKRALLLHYIGSSAFDIFETLSDTCDEKDYKAAMTV